MLAGFRSRSFFSVALALIVLSSAVAASAQGSRARRQLTQINYATSFGTFGRDAYAYVALEKGYFRDAGFDVTITPGSGSVDNIKLVAAGRIDFAPVDFTALVLTRAREGVPVKAVSLVHQHTLSAIFVLKESGISQPKDLEGRKIADAAGSTVAVLFPLYAKKAGIDASKVTFVPAAPPALPSLLASKQVDGVGQFTVGVPLFQKAAGGKQIKTFPYEKFFPGLMGIAIVASDDRIAKSPAEVNRFVGALNRGLQYSIDNPGDAGRILNKYVPLADPVVAAQELRIMKRFVQTPVTRQNGLGYIDPKRVDATISIVANGFKLTSRITRSQVFAPGFTKPPTR